MLLDGLDDAQFIVSRRGHAQLVDKAGYIYNKHHLPGKKVWWKCSEYHKKQFDCKARATTEGSYITKYSNCHTHPVPELVERETGKGTNYLKTKYE